MTGLALVTFGAVAVFGQIDGQAAPNRAEVQAARLEILNAGCGANWDDCHHPSSVAVRAVRCTPQADNRARCRFEERVENFHDRQPRWRRAQFEFVYDTARGRWAMDCRTESTQTPDVNIIRCN